MDDDPGSPGAPCGGGAAPARHHDAATGPSANSSPEEDAVDAYFAATSYRLAALLGSAPMGRPRALLDDYQLAPLHDARASVPARASQLSASWRRLDHLAPPLPHAGTASSDQPSVASTASGASSFAMRMRDAHPSRPSSGWRRILSRATGTPSSERDSGDRMERVAHRARRLFGGQAHTHTPPPQAPTPVSTPSMLLPARGLRPPEVFTTGPGPFVLGGPGLGPGADTAARSISTSPSSGSSLSTGVHTAPTSINSASRSVSFGQGGTTAASLAPISVPGPISTKDAGEHSPSSITGSGSGSRERVKMALPPSVSGRSRSGSTNTEPALGSRAGGQAGGDVGSSTSSFDFDVRRAVEHGSMFWEHVAHVAKRWPELHPDPHHTTTHRHRDRARDLRAAAKDGVLAYTPRSAVHSFVSHFTLGEFLLIYSLGSFDGSAFPPWPTPQLPAEYDGDDIDSMVMIALGHAAAPSTTEYASAMLDQAGAHVIDSFIETRAVFQKHAMSRTGRMAGTDFLHHDAGTLGVSSGTSQGAGMSNAEPLDTESAVDQLEDAAVGSIVEAHVNVIHFFISLAQAGDGRIPAPFPIFERQRLAAMHLNRPLSSLYRRAIAGTRAESAPAVLHAADAVPIEEVAGALAANAEEILAQLEGLLPCGTQAHLAVVDERWTVPLVRGRRWRENSVTGVPAPLGATIRPRWYSPAAHALLNRNAPMVVHSPVSDPRFALRTPFCTAAPDRVPMPSLPDELTGVGFIAVHPVLASSGLPVAVVVVVGPSLGGPSGSPRSWTAEQANVLSVAATQLAGLLEHASEYALGLRKRHMVGMYSALQADVKHLGLTEEGAGLFGRPRGPDSLFGLAGVRGNGLAQGLDEEVEAALEKEQLFAAFQERMQVRGRNRRAQAARDDSLPDVPHQLLPQLGQLLTATAARALGADLVYLARKPQRVQAGASQPTVRWKIVAQSRSRAPTDKGDADTLPASDVLDPEQLARLPLAPAAHNVNDHRGLPALFYNLPLHALSEPHQDPEKENGGDGSSSSGLSASLPWQLPSSSTHTPLFRAGAIISAGGLQLPSLDDGDPLASSADAGGWDRHERSVLLLVILFSDRTRLLSPAEQGFVAALAAGSITWLRQAGTLDAYIRSMEQAQQAPSTAALTTADALIDPPAPSSALTAVSSHASSSISAASRQPPRLRRRPGSAGSRAVSVLGPSEYSSWPCTRPSSRPESGRVYEELLEAHPLPHREYSSGRTSQ